MTVQSSNVVIHGRPQWGGRYWSSSMVAREESSGRIKSGKYDPVQAVGYFRLHMTGLLLEMQFYGRGELRHQQMSYERRIYFKDIV
ncbi:hypothetical protein TIFTF001_016981 [Ficus carica]|uniref:Uncharacterized protein n=1 Tax=Ficus carica TaxID=3494 RepID=A0AA88ATW0_FICCA|nr:hypothetical protein TIFTF001_016981 [Ficus carica]